MPSVEDFKAKWKVVKATKRNGDVEFYLKHKWFFGLFWRTHTVMAGIDYYVTPKYPTEEDAREAIDEIAKHNHDKYMHEITNREDV